MRNTFHGQVAGYLKLIADLFNLGALKSDLRILVALEEIGASKILVAGLVVGIYTGGFNHGQHRGFRGVLFVVENRARNVAEPAAHSTDHQVLYCEIRR